MIAVVYLDACPECPPGIPPASPAIGMSLEVPGGELTAHQCAVCGAAWEAYWRDGWVIDRMVAPVAPDDAARNRETLKRAIRGGSAGWPAARSEAAA